MKIFLKPLCFLLPVLFSTFIGCSDEEINKPDKENTPKITQFEQGDFICKNEGGVYTISFSTNADWKSSINADWCELNPASGNAGKHSITFRVSENTDNEDREAVVRIQCGTDFRTFKVSQKREQVIIASPESITVGYSGEIVEINVQSNIDYTYTLQDEWISIAPETKSVPLNSTTWRFNIAENTTPYSRQSKIFFAGNEKSSEVVINQGCYKTPEEYDFESNGLFYKFLSVQDLTVELVGGQGVYTGVIHIPEEVEYNGKLLKVIRIGTEAFLGCSVSEVTIGKNVKYIDTRAFYESAISSIVIPEQVIGIRANAFSKCKNLSVFISDGDNKLYFDASYYYTSPFYQTPIQRLYVGRNLDYNTNRTLFDDLSNTEKITIGSRMTRIEDYMFRDASSVTELVIPANVTYIGEGAFYGCTSLEEVIFEDTQDELVFSERRIFPHCSSLDYVYIGRTITPNVGGGWGPFSSSPITKIDIGSLVTSLPKLENLQLEEITIPASVRRIDDFSGCSRLRSIICKGITPPLADWDSYFDNTVYANCILFVPIESVATYQSADVWKNFFNIQPIANQ